MSVLIIGVDVSKNKLDVCIKLANEKNPIDMEIYDEKLRSEFLLLTNKLLRCFWKYEFFPVGKYGFARRFLCYPLDVYRFGFT